MQKNYYSIFDGNVLVAFINLMEEDKEIFLGISVNSNLLNQGYGKASIRLASEISGKLYPNKSLYLEVRTFNKRAINCYKSAGFEIDGDAFIQTTHIGEGEFFRMVKKK